ncbi:hypothetical protein CYME_CMT370C [Cyanidioschyzon merolae strain 10D]|uniref:Uncharacterized protein n=1 Tax=Cyanidioschyzon merolae (strain NIES-3377 / 10D) TaxID=280699 RepID=M1V7S2_CYAM1|nr:hypothetical protein CYME_CMT370C [Cyanidioschyzon merolae strain 10D]BAM83320.1 hypothetical protein CYME_CMT370C [Cyanidioschyzon merolae strain 10D]|eukprot:XP_005539356.1 hypothetical protein CYME_CMT370C [Cyanidioschyzon merolae strain 10D]
MIPAKSNSAAVPKHAPIRKKEPSRRARRLGGTGPTPYTAPSLKSGQGGSVFPCLATSRCSKASPWGVSAASAYDPLAPNSRDLICSQMDDMATYWYNTKSCLLSNAVHRFSKRPPPARALRLDGALRRSRRSLRLSVAQAALLDALQWR